MITDENEVSEISEALPEKNREVYEMLAQAENDVRNHRVASIQQTFDELRKQLNLNL